MPPYRAGYSSFLSGAYGHTYGCFGIWNWGVPVRWAPAYDFQTALTLPSVTHMRHMSEFFLGLDWWTLEPCHELILNQPDDWLRKRTAAKRSSGDLVVAYAPQGNDIQLETKTLPRQLRGQWFNPLAGTYHAIPERFGGGTAQSFMLSKGWEEGVLVLKGAIQ